MNPIHDFSFAPFHAPDDRVWVRSIGHFRLEQVDEGSQKLANFAELFWCISGTGYFVRNGRKELLFPGEAYYYPPGSRHRFGPHGGAFEYRWLALEGSGAHMIFDLLGMSGGVRKSGICPDREFVELGLLLPNPDATARRKSLSVAFDILSRAATPDPQRTPCDRIQNAREIIEADFSHPGLNVTRIADELGISRVYLSREFSLRYGVPISNYLNSLRLKNALELLKNSDLTMGEIAERSGYSSAGYFAKVIRRATGASPGELRR